jgi:cytochrome c oxidase cbb3-type subunit 1
LWVVAIGWQIGVAVGVASLLMGYTSTKEYAEFEWPVDRTQTPKGNLSNVKI